MFLFFYYLSSSAFACNQFSIARLFRCFTFGVYYLSIFSSAQHHVAIAIVEGLPSTDHMTMVMLAATAAIDGDASLLYY